MAENTGSQAPQRGAEHERLSVFLGKWHAEGESYAAGQSKDNPRSAVEKWSSDETFEWLPGKFFLLQRWDAMIGANAFNGIAIVCCDPETDNYTTRSYENHGFIRDYATRVDGDVWTFAGGTERARIEFTDGGDRQKINWEWRKAGEDWLPLCDRVAKRVG